MSTQTHCAHAFQSISDLEITKDRRKFYSSTLSTEVGGLYPMIMKYRSD